MTDLTVVIPTRDRRDSLLRTLASLRAQVADATFDILVVDDGGTDGTADAVHALARSPEWAGLHLACIQQAWRGAAAARNTGLGNARGRVVLFLDDDVRARPNLIAGHLRHHASGPDTGQADGGTVVLGMIEPLHRPEVMHRQIRRWWTRHYEGLRGRDPRFTDVYTGNVSVPRAAAVAVGGFDESLAYFEDGEFGYRLAEAGLRIVYEPGARVTTLNTKSAAGLIEDVRRGGRGAVRVHRKHPTTLAALPLGGYGATSLRLRVVRGAMLWASRVPPVRAALDAVIDMWASRRRPSRLDGRIFDLVRAYAYWSGVRAEATTDEWERYSSAGVPVLCYHSVEPRPPASAGLYVVSNSTLSRQMRVIRLLGFTVRPLDEIVDRWERGIAPPPLSLVITFDDGYRNNLDHAWPILRRHRYAATLFSVSGLLGGRSVWDEHVEPGPRPLLTEAELRELDQAGFRVESHGVSHADLRTVSETVAAEEITTSRRELARILGRPVDLFAYPYGHDDATIQQLTAAAGYRAAFSTRWGLNTPATPRFGLCRIQVLGTDNLVVFALKVLVGVNPLRLLPRPTFRR